MTIPTACGGRWPAGLAYFAALIFTLASGGTNLVYGWQKGGDLAGSIVWTAVSVGVSIVFALSWPALLKAADAGRWCRVLIVLVALGLSGLYSVSAALGSAMGGRTNAANQEQTAAGARSKAQAAYDRAEQELAKLTSARPAAELEALVRGAARNPRAAGCAAVQGSLALSCPKLEGELARARQRDRLKADMDRSAFELSNIGAAKVANADARALSGYLNDLGFATDAERLNKLLVLLAVLIVECGGGLALAVGMSLSEPAPERRTAPDVPPEQPPCPRPPPIVQACAARPPTIRGPANITDIAEWLQRHGGSARTTMRALAKDLGRPPSTLHGELRRLAFEGRITVKAERRGTLLGLGKSGRAQ